MNIDKPRTVAKVLKDLKAEDLAKKKNKIITYMKSVIFLVFIYLFSSFSLAINFNQIPLTEYIKENEAENMQSANEAFDYLYYVYSRCSSLYAYVYQLTKNPRTEKEKLVNKNALTNHTIFKLGATKFWMLTSKNSDINKSNEHIMTLIKAMVNNYQKDGKQYFASVGKHLEGYIMDDSIICESQKKDVLESIN